MVVDVVVAEDGVVRLGEVDTEVVVACFVRVGALERWRFQLAAIVGEVAGAVATVDLRLVEGSSGRRRSPAADEVPFEVADLCYDRISLSAGQLTGWVPSVSCNSPIRM